MTKVLKQRSDIEKKVVQDGREILIPYLEANKYPNSVIGIMDKIHSNADTVDKKPEDLKWYISYLMPSDPVGIKDEIAFIDYMIKNTRVFLIARGFHRKLTVDLDGSFPARIKNRYEEHAKIVCRARIDDNQHPEIIKTGFSANTSFHDKIDAIINKVDEFDNAYPSSYISLDKSLVRIIKIALKELKNCNK